MRRLFRGVVVSGLALVVGITAAVAMLGEVAGAAEAGRPKVGSRLGSLLKGEGKERRRPLKAMAERWGKRRLSPPDPGGSPGACVVPPVLEKQKGTAPKAPSPKSG